MSLSRITLAFGIRRRDGDTAVWYPHRVGGDRVMLPRRMVNASHSMYLFPFALWSSPV